MIRLPLVVLSALLAACAVEPSQDARADSVRAAQHVAAAAAGAPSGLARAALLGAWSADGEQFVWLIESDSILFEQDMQRYPYQIAGDTLLIDRSAAAIGVQKTRVLRLAGDTMIIQAPDVGASEVLLRLR